MPARSSASSPTTGRTLKHRHLSVEICAEILVAAVASATRGETPEARQLLEDRLLEAPRIAKTLRRPGPLRDYAAHVESRVEGGRVRLYGAVASRGAIREIGDLVAHPAGVAAVSNDITLVRSYADSRSDASEQPRQPRPGQAAVAGGCGEDDIVRSK